MSITKEESQRLIKFWGDHLKQWSRSRMSQNEYCRKNKENQKKHGVSFALAQLAFFDHNRIILEDLEHSIDEKRY